MFKEIKAVFKVVKDNAFLEGKWGKNREGYEFCVERVESGCTNYGDNSAHFVKLLNGEYEKSYDTRYDCISTQKDKWVEFWKTFIERDWQLELQLESYQEKEVE